MIKIKSNQLYFSLLILMLLFPLIITSDTYAQDAGPETHEILIQNNRFVPDELTINVGDIVKFVWSPGAVGHNVAQTDSSSTTNYNDGFTSGDPQSYPYNWTLPGEYTESDTTLFYICVPHIGSGMRGSIIVGDGGEDNGLNTTTIWIAIISISLLLTVGFVIAMKKMNSDPENGN